jgi:hypothetical protein
LGVSVSALTFLMIGPETDWSFATIMGTGLGLIVSLAFAAWWMTIRLLSRLRDRPVTGTDD